MHSFSYKGFKNKNGGCITKFLNADSTLSVNINYIVAVFPSLVPLCLHFQAIPRQETASDLLKLQDHWTYNNSLVIRAPIVGGKPVVPQGDTSELSWVVYPHHMDLVNWLYKQKCILRPLLVGQTDGITLFLLSIKVRWLTGIQLSHNRLKTMKSAPIGTIMP